MPPRDLAYWNRRTQTASILANLRWTLGHIWAIGRGPALGILVVQILLGLQPALLIYVTEHLIDTVVAAAGQGEAGFGQVLPWLAAFGVTLLLTNEVLWKLRDLLHMRLQQKLEYALGRRFLEKSSQLPLVFFEVSAFYDRLERARNPGRKLDRFFSATMHGFRGAVTAVSVAAMFVPVAWWLGLALVAVLLPQIRLELEQSRMFMGFTYGQTEEQRRADYVDRVLTGRGEQKEMRLFALHATLARRWEGLRRALRQRLWDQKRQQARGGLPVAGVRVGVSIGVGVVLAFFLGDRLLTPGRFVALFRGVDDMMRTGFTLGYSARELQNQSVEIDWVRQFLELEDSELDKDGGGWRQGDGTEARDRDFPRPLRQGIAVEGVEFAYPAAGPDSEEVAVLRGVDLVLKPGERVALVGANGAGKSTLAKILLGLYAQTAGRVCADGVDYRRIAPASLAAGVSAAFQDFFNFEFTLGQSIGVGVLGAGRDGAGTELWPAGLQPDRVRVEAAARRTGADAIAAGLPSGYDAPVGHTYDGGQGLSGGQWQRLAIARAYSRRPELMILDEPTAALDPMAEAELYRQFGQLLDGQTTLLISHRLGSARMADRILVLEDGRIAEEGDHEALLALGGTYATMWEEQAAWYR